MLLTLLYYLEDQQLVRVALVKSNREAKNCWKSLLKEQFEMDPWTLMQTEKKMALEKFQRQVSYDGMLHIKSLYSDCVCLMQHPGFDFSGADISGNYVDGGAPDI